MPRASLNPDRAKQGGGVEAGNYEITAAKFMNIKTDFKPVTVLTQIFDCRLLDKSGEPVRGADPIEISFGFGEKSLEAFHPGEGSGPEDTNPDDMGDSIDAEGNTIYCAGSEQFSKSCSAVVFNHTLAMAGFPKTTLDRCWAGDFIGIKFSLETLPAKDVNERFGTRLNTKPMADGGTVTYKVCTKWLNAAGGTGKSAKGKKDSEGAGGAGGAGNEATESAKPKTAEEIAKHVLAIVAKKRPGKKNVVKTKQALSGFFTNEFTKDKQPGKMLRECQALIGNDEWIVGAVAELGGECSINDDGAYDGGAVEFPEAE